MRWSLDVDPPEVADWNLWFAWHPITIGTTRVWLERIERKEFEWAAYDTSGISYEYRFQDVRR